MKQTSRIVILGPQGAGKGTQAGRLSHRLHIPHISSGDLLRAEVHRHTPLGHRIEKLINAGKFIPDQIMLAVMRGRLDEGDAKHGWISDGFPRRLPQVPAFQKFGQPNLVIFLHLTDHAAVHRLSGRRVCAHGHIYHIDHAKPRRRGICDHDGLHLWQREDDTPKAIRKRLHLYHTLTEPVLHWYRRKGLVIEIDASRSIHQVYGQIIKKLAPTPWLSSRLRTT